MTNPAEQAARIVNQYLVCSDATYLEHLIAAALRTARREEREATLLLAFEWGLMERKDIDNIDRARAQESRS